MQTPAGYSIDADGRFIPEDWWAIIFNPSFFVRLPHMVLASYLCVAFLVGGVGAYHLLRDAQNQAARTMFSMALWMATLVAPAQIVVGDLHGLNTLAHQPAKIAAMEGDFETERGAPEILFGIPNMKEQRTDYKIAIPYLGSLILTHSLDGEVPGLKQWPRADQPYSPLIFFTFRIMVGLGFLMATIGLVSLWLRRGARLYRARWLQRIMVAMAPAGFIALLCGWITTEVGRQPYTVYGLLRTSDSLSPIGLPGVATSLVAVRRRLFHRLFRRHRLSVAADGAAAASGRARTARGRADSRRRPHAGPRRRSAAHVSRRGNRRCISICR